MAVEFCGTQTHISKNHFFDVIVMGKKHLQPNPNLLIPLHDIIHFVPDHGPRNGEEEATVTPVHSPGAL